MCTVQLIIAYNMIFFMQSIILAVKAKDGFLAYHRWHLCTFLCGFSLLFKDWAKNATIGTKNMQTFSRITSITRDQALIVSLSFHYFHYINFISLLDNDMK
jgi:hypothetical protein